MTHPGRHIGTLIKPHGFKGEMQVRGSSQTLENLTEGMPLFVEIAGQRIPFFIESLSGEPAGDTSVIKLEFIDSDAEARKYSGKNVYAEHIPASSGTGGTTGADLIGYLVTDKNSGSKLEVVDYDDQSGNPLFILDLSGREILLPANADYILSIDPSTRKIQVDFPEGLLE